MGMNGGINWEMLNRLTGRNNPGYETAPAAVQLPVLSVVLVDGRSGADAYPVPPNCQGVPLFDRETGALYIKSSDAYGVPRVVEFEPPVPKQTESDIQKAMLVKMDERMNRMEEAFAKLLDGGVQNGAKSDTSSSRSTKNSKSDSSTASTNAT